jgi:hypothetical protein
MADPTRTVWLWRGPARTVHELDCGFLTRRVNNGLRLEDQYEQVSSDRVPVEAHRCRHCAPRVDPRR